MNKQTKQINKNIHLITCLSSTRLSDDALENILS